MDAGLSFLWMLVQTIVALAVVCGLAYLLFRVVLPRFTYNSGSKSMVRIVDRVPIDARKSLCVIEVAGKWLLVSVSEGGVELVAELDEKAASAAEKHLNESGKNKTNQRLEANLSEKVSDLVGSRRSEK